MTNLTDPKTRGFLENRRKGISGTDIPAIVGMSKYKSKFDVWLEKTGQAEPREETLPMKLGLKLEPVICDLYEEETGVRPEVVDPPVLFRKDIFCGSPDRRVLVNGGIKVLELKTAGERQGFLWGEPGTDEVPKDYFLQTMWYMPLMQTDQADIAALIGNRKFAIYHITLDLEILAYLEEEAEKFWVDHVLTGKPPEIGATEGAKNWLRKMFPQDQGVMLEPTDSGIINLIERFRNVRDERITTEKMEEALENQIKAFIGTNAGVEGDWGKITWKKAKDSLITDWKALAYKLFKASVYADDIALEDCELFKEFTKIRPGSRRFLPRFKED